jgi:hypothetical protein
MSDAPMSAGRYVHYIRTVCVVCLGFSCDAGIVPEIGHGFIPDVSSEAHIYSLFQPAIVLEVRPCLSTAEPRVQIPVMCEIREDQVALPLGSVSFLVPSIARSRSTVSHPGSVN